MTSTAIVVTVLGIVLGIMVPMSLLFAYVVYRLTNRFAHLHGAGCAQCIQLSNSSCLHVDTSHNHDTMYAGLDHDHDDAYSRLGHDHPEYADRNHDHDDRYATKERLDALGRTVQSSVGINMFSETVRELNERIDGANSRVDHIVAERGSRIPKGMLVGAGIGALIGAILVFFFMSDSFFVFNGILTVVTDGDSETTYTIASSNPAIKLGYVVAFSGVGAFLGGMYAWLTDLTRGRQARHSSTSN